MIAIEKLAFEIRTVCESLSGLLKTINRFNASHIPAKMAIVKLVCSNLGEAVSGSFRTIKGKDRWQDIGKARQIASALNRASETITSVLKKGTAAFEGN